MAEMSDAVANAKALGNLIRAVVKVNNTLFLYFTGKGYAIGVHFRLHHYRLSGLPLSPVPH